MSGVPARLACLLLAAPLAAQMVNPGATAPPEASTGTAVSSGTAAAPPAVDLSSSAAGGAAVSPPPAPPKPSASPNPLRVKIHKEAASWEPISVKAGGGAEAARNGFAWRLKKGKKGKASGGKTSKAKSIARLYKAGDDARLVISVFPDALKEQRAHVELRYLIVEGFLEKVEAAAVIADEGAGPQDDARMLEAKGVGFQEEFPGAGALTISAIDAKPSKSALNSGSLKLAAFAESDLNPRSLGLVSLEYAAKGVADARKR